jgi:hypothetical protein
MLRLFLCIFLKYCLMYLSNASVMSMFHIVCVLCACIRSAVATVIALYRCISESRLAFLFRACQIVPHIKVNCALFSYNKFMFTGYKETNLLSKSRSSELPPTEDGGNKVLRNVGIL